ncbi:MAG: molybdenum cofactor guanylyltransferase [Pseudanabaena sp.]|jgi:molybdopterin-guanine dinucleotide biosynthesis protein A
MKITAIALAGGKSSRMGSDKALLEIKGETLLSRTSHIALLVADSVYIVARSQQQYQHLTTNHLKSIHLVVDKKLDGALMGFWQGIQAIANSPPDWLLLLACDLPNIQSDILQTWASQLDNLPQTVIAYLPHHVESDSNQSPKQWEPLCGFYRWQCQASLAEVIEKGERSFQKWLDTQEVVEIPYVPLDMLFNCNTPYDFLKAVQSKSQSSSLL